MDLRYRVFLSIDNFFYIKNETNIIFTIYLYINIFIIIKVKYMVAVVRISKDRYLLEIKEVSDKYRDIPYSWDED